MRFERIWVLLWPIGEIGKLGTFKLCYPAGIYPFESDMGYDIGNQWVTNVLQNKFALVRNILYICVLINIKCIKYETVKKFRRIKNMN